MSKDTLIDSAFKKFWDMWYGKYRGNMPVDAVATLIEDCKKAVASSEIKSNTLIRMLEEIRSRAQSIERSPLEERPLRFQADGIIDVAQQALELVSPSEIPSGTLIGLPYCPFCGGEAVDCESYIECATCGENWRAEHKFIRARSEIPVKKWSFCPECGCEEYAYAASNKEHCCNECGQSWFSDIDYFQTLHSNFRRMALALRDIKREAQSEIPVIDDAIAERLAIGLCQYDIDKMPPHVSKNFSWPRSTSSETKQQFLDMAMLSLEVLKYAAPKREAQSEILGVDWKQKADTASHNAKLYADKCIVLEAEIESLNKRESGRDWRDYPACKPFQIDPHTPVSHPMLFLTESGDESHIRLGYYDFRDGGFYESGTEGAPYHSSVTRYFTIPYPKTKTLNSLEDAPPAREIKRELSKALKTAKARVSEAQKAVPSIIRTGSDLHLLEMLVSEIEGGAS